MISLLCLYLKTGVLIRKFMKHFFPSISIEYETKVWGPEDVSVHVPNPTKGAFVYFNLILLDSILTG